MLKNAVCRLLRDALRASMHRVAMQLRYLYET